MDFDTFLTELVDELRAATVKGSHFAAVWMGAGIQAAADIVEQKRIEVLCGKIVLEDE